MSAFVPDRRLTAVAAVFAVLMAGTGVQAQTATPAPPAPATAPTPVPDITTVTIFGKKHEPGDVSRTRIDTKSGSSCGFMNTNDGSGQDMIDDYLRSFTMDQNGSNQGIDADRSDPNDPANTFKDTAAFGDASQSNSANSNTILPVDSEGNAIEAAGRCGPSDKAFAAGRNFIARTDTSFKDAYAAFDARDYPKALDLFKKSYGKVGIDEAAMMVGKMYLAGLGTPRDPAQAIVWLKKVAEAPFSPEQAQHFNPDEPDYAETRAGAAMLLGKLYLAGSGTRRDPKQALHWYMKAAEFGYIPANHIIGEFYQTGAAGEKNMTKAVEYFKKAGIVGYAPSEYALGVIYYDGVEGIPEDRKMAAQWLIEAAKRGDVDALFAVGNMYDQGDTLPEDPSKAIVYFKEAALKGHPGAADELGLYFYTGTAVPKDAVTARKWFDAAAKAHDGDAMFNLAVMTANGEGGPKDMVLAYVWMRLSEASGIDKAGPAAKELEGKLTPEEKAKADAVLNPPAGTGK